MRQDDIIALAILAGLGAFGYLLYKKEIDWPFADIGIPNPLEGIPEIATKSNDEEGEIENELDDSGPAPTSTSTDDDDDTTTTTDYSGAKGIFDEALKAGDKFLRDLTGAQGILSDAFKRGDSALDKLAKAPPKKGTKPGATLIVPPKRKPGEKSLEELLADAFKTDNGKFPCGSPQRPYC